MKLYIEDKDIGKTVTFTDEKRQGLYVHGDKEGFVFKSLAEHDKELVQEKDLLYKSLLAMATQLNDVYDTEGCMYGDEISGYTPEETANAYIEETKKKLRGDNKWI